MNTDIRILNEKPIGLADLANLIGCSYDTAWRLARSGRRCVDGRIAKLGTARTAGRGGVVTSLKAYDRLQLELNGVTPHGNRSEEKAELVC